MCYNFTFATRDLDFTLQQNISIILCKLNKIVSAIQSNGVLLHEIWTAPNHRK